MKFIEVVKHREKNEGSGAEDCDEFWRSEVLSKCCRNGRQLEADGGGNSYVRLGYQSGYIIIIE